MICACVTQKQRLTWWISLHFSILLIAGANKKKDGKEKKILQFIFSLTRTRSLTLNLQLHFDIQNFFSPARVSARLRQSWRRKAGRRKMFFPKQKQFFSSSLSRLERIFLRFRSVATFCFSRVFPLIFPRICKFVKSAFSKSKQTDLEFCDLRVGKINTEKKGKAKKRN